MLNFVKIGSVVLEKKIFKFCQCPYLFRNYLPLEMGMAFHLNNLDSLSLKAALCQVWINWPNGSAEDI